MEGHMRPEEKHMEKQNEKNIVKKGRKINRK